MKKIFCLLAVLIFAVNAYAAPTFNDVPENHWAYSVVSRVADKGIMTGDTQGNFKPESLIDKFETARIFARAAGYKSVGASDVEQIYFDRAYEKNKSLIGQYAKSLTKWNNISNREIAFLLEKEIFTVADLNQFVIKDTDGTEKLRALSREEAAMYITKLMGHNTEALTKMNTQKPKDDSKISDAARPYVYYMRYKSIIIDDETGNFNPNMAVTKASLAGMLSKALNLSGDGATSSPSQAAPSNSTSVETVTGTIDKLLSPSNAIQLTEESGGKKIFLVNGSATITVDSFLKTFADLKEGMKLVGVINNAKELIDIKAQSVSVTTTIVPQENIQLSTIKGTVESKETTVSGQTLSVRISLSETATDTRSFVIAYGCKIFRGEKEATFQDITPGEEATIQISGSKIHEIRLLEKYKKFDQVTLIDKVFIEKTKTPTLIVTKSKDSKEQIELVVGPESKISRKDTTVNSWLDLRVGDLLDITTEFETVSTLFAYGTKTTAEATLEEIHITKDGARIIVKDDANTLTTRNVITSTVDVYSLRIGARLLLRLDSQEVEAANVIESPRNKFFSGFITNKRLSTIMVQELNTMVPTTKEVKFDEGTIVFNSTSGQYVSTSSLKEGMRVYIVFTDSATPQAKTITVLGTE